LHPHLMILLIGLLYILLFGGLSLLRREGLSNQFAFEVLGITAAVLLGAVVTNTTVDPILFLILIYLLSMRVRILVDVAAFFAARGQSDRGLSLLRLALWLGPDQAGRLVVLVNWGIMLLSRGDTEGAKELFQQVLEAGAGGGFGLKYETACRYNLAIAWHRLGNEAEAVRQFNEVIDLMPSSIYGREAERALAQRRQHNDKGLRQQRQQGDEGEASATTADQEEPPWATKR
jgi:tetratricopeptide (TPR) repeat protein